MPIFGENQKLTIVGSTSVQPICEELVNEYKKSHPEVDINIQGGGSALGIKCTNSNHADIGMSSKDVFNDSNLKTYELGNDAIIIVVNPENPINDLSKSQIKNIFSGKIKDWGEISNRSGPINVVIREEGSGTLNTFKDIVMCESNIKEDAVVQNSAGCVKKIIMHDKNAIGFVSYMNMDNSLKNISINDISPSKQNIVDGKYILQRPFLLLTNSTPDNETQNFINWVNENDAEKILNEERIFKVD